MERDGKDDTSHGAQNMDGVSARIFDYSEQKTQDKLQWDQTDA